MTMTLHDALTVLAEHRGANVVITTMSPIGVWAGLSDSPLDFAYIPSAMGHAPALGLGLALAQDRHGVIVVNGDGCMLMSLGSLVTLAQNPANVYLLVIDNGHYEVTGGQPIAGAGRIDFAGMARAAGIRRTYVFDTAEAWRAGARAALARPGPVVIHLKIEGRRGQKTPKPPRPMEEQLRRLRQGLGAPTSVG
jgi:thiamine pyrophosphate-dependent acetolactate synthase large subunit-like protein